MVHITGAVSDVCKVFLFIVPSVLVVVVNMFIIYAVLTGHSAGGVVRPVGRVTSGNDNSPCSRLLPLSRGVTDRRERVGHRVHELRFRGSGVSALVRGVTRNFVLVSISGGILVDGCSTSGLLNTSSSNIASGALVTFSHGRILGSYISGTLSNRDGGNSAAMGKETLRVVAGPICSGNRGGNTVYLVVSISTGGGTRGVHHRFATGMARRLGAPLASVSNCTRVVTDNLMGPSSVPGFTGGVRGRSNELLSLVDSVVRLSRLSRGFDSRRFTPISLTKITTRITRSLHSGTRGRKVAVAISAGATIVGNGHGRVCRLVCGLYSGTVHCGHRGNSMGVVANSSGRRPFIGITSAKVNVPRGRRGHIFRHFCHISGDHSGRANNANLKLTVIGRVARERNKRVSLRDDRRKAAFATEF